MTESTEPMPEQLSEASAADIAEQHRPVSAEDSEPGVSRSGAGSEMDEADAWEQDQDVPVEDDDADPGAG